MTETPLRGKIELILGNSSLTSAQKVKEITRAVQEDKDND